MNIIVLLIILLFFILSQFFSGMETGFISMDRLSLEQEAKKDKKMKRLLSFVEEPSRFLGVTLIGNNISNVVISTLFAVFFIKKIPYFSETVLTLIVAGLILIFGEIIPKSVYRDNPIKRVSRSFTLIYAFYLIFKPLISVINIINLHLSKLLKLDQGNNFSFLTRDDLTILLTESTLDDSIEFPQKEILEEVMEFNELTAKNVMTPRLDIIAIPSNASVNDIIKIAQEEGYTRYPVYNEDIDNVVGILIIYDLVKQSSTSELKASDFIREALFIPETMDVNTLLKEMQTARKSMAIAIDSFGGTAGLVTIEDILEEIFGEIEDEYDFEELEGRDVERVDQNTLICNGLVEIDYLNDEYDCDLPEGDYETLAGLIIDRLMRIPTRGTTINVGNWKFEVLQATSSKIIKVQLTKHTTAVKKH
ncbi:MAG: hemolysin family protein [Candidatus Cloacimonas sp.]|nr:hemolysin family protein [Candidatus Cloacimonadota bacterium]